MRHWYRAGLALSLATATLTAQSDPDARARSDGDAAPGAHRIVWQRTFADAEALARTTGRPLFVALNMDGESASDRIWYENYRDPDFVASTRRCVCVGASVFRHNADDYDADGRRVECPRFPGLTCGEHIALEPELFARVFKDGERVAPRHALVRGDGGIAFDLSLCFDLADVDRALAAATAGIEPWQPPAGGDWNALAARRDADGRAALEAAVAACRDPAELRAAFAALRANGDAGALPALRRLLVHCPDLAPAPLAEIAAVHGAQAAWQSVLRERVQRLAPLPGGLEPPPDFAPLLATLTGSDADVAARTWACGLAAVASDQASWQAVRQAFQAESVPPVAFPPVAIARLRQLGAAAVVGYTALPVAGVPDRELATADALLDALQQLDKQLAEDRNDAAALAAAGIASLDLGRIKLTTGDAQTLLLFEDADRYLQRAQAARGERYEWWIERARAAYYLQRFDAEKEHAVHALAMRGLTWPLPADPTAGLLQDAQTVEALRWIGDADARRFAAAPPADAGVAIATVRSALLALGLAAVSPFGTGGDFVACGSLLESLGLLREQVALLAIAQHRLPSAGDVRQALAGALWRGGQWQLLAPLADATAAEAPGAESDWWAGYAHLQLAEELRRRERPLMAAGEYALAEQRLAAAAATNPAYADNVRSYVASCWLGRGLAFAQGPLANRRSAAACLVRAVATGADVTGLRDGIGYDALDLVDKVLEWRATGPSPVDPAALLDELANVGGASLRYWAVAVCDSETRELLRADGRNPQRVEGETVDAAGRPIRMLMGLPTELGDRYLAAALTAGEHAVAAPGAGADERRCYAQALTIGAERELARGRTDGVRASLQRAADALALTLPVVGGEAADTVDALRALAAPLRAELGPARPRLREGR